MKKQLILIGSLITGVLLAACKEEMPTVFTGQDGVHFNTPSDSVIYSFAKYPNRTADTLRLPVMVLGNIAPADRTITIEKLTGNDVNAVEGVHYKMLSSYVMPAGKVSAEIPVAIFRTGDLDSITATFRVGVKANNDFITGISSKTSVKVKVGYLQKPPTWGEINGTQWAGFSGNFGTWTKAKYKLVLDALYDPAADSTVSEFPVSRFSAPTVYLQYLQLVRNHIRTKYPGNYSNPVGIGPTLRDPDANNAVIQVGPANY